MTGKSQEIWEATTGGTTHINVKDPRNPEGWTTRKVGGRGSKRITLSAEEREFNSELVPYENAHLDPFKNGLLIQISPNGITRGANEMSDEQLIEILSLDSDPVFEAAMEQIEAEVPLRRLLALSKKHASMLRHETVQNRVDDRFSLGKTSRVVKEAQDDDGRYADADL